MATTSLRALLAQSVDYAGLFPPASLALEPALRNQANYVRSPENWMLGGFVLPVKKFPEVSAHLVHFDAARQLCLSVLGPKTENARQFIEELTNAAQAIREFQTSHAIAARVGQIEMELPANAGASLAETNTALAGLEIPVFWEGAINEAERTIGFIAERRRTGAGRFGFKLRTGGVIASAFPSSVQIARALVAAAKLAVPIKFTAGLRPNMAGTSNKLPPCSKTKMRAPLFSTTPVSPGENGKSQPTASSYNASWSHPSAAAASTNRATTCAPCICSSTR